MKFTLAEQETVITTDRTQDTWQVYTTDPFMMKKLSKLTNPRKVDQDSDGVYAMTFDLPLTWIPIRRPKQLSERQKAALRKGQTKELAH